VARDVEIRLKLTEQLCMRQQFILHVLIERQKLGIEGIVE
jgi:hypothetical protein